jgi:hypothetical protein
MSETPQETLRLLADLCERMAVEPTVSVVARADNARYAEAIRAVLAQLEKPLDVPYTTSCGHTWTMRHTACPTCFGELKAERDALRAELDRPKHETLRQLADAVERHDWQKARAEKAEAEVARLRDIISPGDAAAYEERMAALQAGDHRLSVLGAEAILRGGVKP